MQVRSLTAAARSKTRATGSDKISKKTAGWQEKAWGYYDTVGELRYVCEWIGNALSRCTIMASSLDEDGDPVKSCDNDVVRAIVRDIAGGPAGQADLLGKFAAHLTIPGECWLAIIVREDEAGRSVEEWHVLSTSEVEQKRNGGTVTLTLPDGSRWDLDPEVDSIHRVWKPHARVAAQADSVTRACLPILSQMTRLDQWVDATAKSRLVSNGILAIPNELSVPSFDEAPTGGTAWQDSDAPGIPGDDFTLPDPGADIPQQHAGAEALTDALLEVIETAVQDPSSAAALAPIVVEAPGEYIGQIKHITFGSEFTDTVMKLREAATRRLSLSLNVPPEILTGLGATNHWSAWQVEESAIKLHIEPLLTTICDRLTKHILAPLLAEAGIDPSEYVIWYDTSSLTLKPNRAEDAKDAHAAGIISDEAYLRELGFTETDLPAEDMSPIQRRNLVIQLVRGAPSLLPQVAHLLGIEIADANPITPVSEPMPAPRAKPDERSAPERNDE